MVVNFCLGKINSKKPVQNKLERKRKKEGRQMKKKSTKDPLKMPSDARHSSLRRRRITQLLKTTITRERRREEHSNLT